MVATGAAPRRRSGEASGARARRARAAVAAAAAALCVLSGCATPAAPPPDPQAVRAEIEAGLDLYDAGEFALSAQRFRSAADAAARARDGDTETRALVAECTAWLRAGRGPELAACTARLEPLQMRRSRSDPGVNTLLALGAVAGGRPLPRLRIPHAVRPFVAGTALESQ